MRILNYLSPSPLLDPMSNNNPLVVDCRCILFWALCRETVLVDEPRLGDPPPVMVDAGQQWGEGSDYFANSRQAIFSSGQCAAIACDVKP